MGDCIKRYDLRYDGGNWILVGRYCDDEGLTTEGDPSPWSDEATCKNWLIAKELLRLARREGPKAPSRSAYDDLLARTAIEPEFVPLTTQEFRKHHGPESAWQTANGRMFLGNPEQGGIALYIAIPKAVDSGSSGNGSQC